MDQTNILNELDIAQPSGSANDSSGSDLARGVPVQLRDIPVREEFDFFCDCPFR